MNFILSIDQGTTSSRAVLFNQQGDIIDVSQKEFKQHYPKNGWVEHDADVIWKDTKACIQKVSKGREDKIKAIGITNQRETTVLWDKETGKPIHHAIVWQDRRTADYCKELVEAGHAEEVQQKTGLLIDSYFSATKIKWLLDNVEGARDLMAKDRLAFGTIDSWLLWNLTDGAVHATDVTNASRTLLYDIQNGWWDKDLLELFDIDISIMPAVHPNVHEYGFTELLGSSLPITGIAGDQQAATIGQACFEPGMVKSTYGTGCFVLFNIGAQCQYSDHKLLSTIAYEINDHKHYAIEGSIFNAGTAIQWLRDGLGIIKDAKETQELAESVEDTDGVYFIPAFTGLGAPYWDSQARGTICGITRDTHKAHIIRATLEAQAYQTRDLLEAMQKDSGGEKIQALRVDGGMVKNDFVCQWLADILQIPVERPVVIETTALGAAYCAGLGVGLYHGLEDISNAWALDKRFEPKMEAKKANSLYQGWQEAVRQILK